MSYSRRILHYSPGPTDFQSLISDRAVAGCSFELNRLGGCGKGELKLNDEFADRSTITVGDWIAFEYSEGDRWYMGRVEHRSATVPAGVSFQLAGMSVELSEVFAGGFNPTVGQGIPPHRYANTDLFPNDPDRGVESIDIVSEPRELVILLMQQYVVPNSHITLDTSLVDTLTNPSSVTSLKLRGEESIQSVIKDLALRAGHASWGVQPDGKFFYLQKPTTVAATWRIGRDFISLEETIERNQLYNRITLTGGYVYDEKINSGHNARGIYRWRGNYTQPASRSQYGERRIRMNIPWIRTSTDSREFAREFFRVYAEPTTRYFLEVGNQSALLIPWTGQVKIEDQSGQEIFTSAVETVRVQFDHAPRFQVEIGPDDPQLHWPEPSFDERWEIPENTPLNPISNGGDEISLTYFGTESLSGLPSSSTSNTSSTSSSSYSPSSYPSSSYSSSYSSSSSSTPPPCGIAHDTFTDTDGTALASHTMDTGTGWTVESGTWTIQSNAVEVSTGKTNYSTTASDAKVECDITHGASGANAVYMHFRRTDATNYWYIDIYTANNSLKLMSKTGGTSTLIEEYDMGSVSAGDSHLYAVRCDGDIIMVDIDGTEVLTHESSLRNTATGFALEAARVSGSAVNIFDNFCIEEYTDTTKPSCTLTTPLSTVTTDTFTVTATFSKEVTGFALGDISVTNGTASSLSGSGKDYTFTVTATALGDVTTSVAADVATDSNSNTNSASNSLVTNYEAPATCDTSFQTTYPKICLTLGLIDTDNYYDIQQGDLDWGEYEMGASAWYGTVDGATWYIECSSGVYSLRSDAGYDEDSTGGTFPDLTFPGMPSPSRTSMETAVTCPLNEEPPA